MQLKCDKKHLFHFDCMQEYYRSMAQQLGSKKCPVCFWPISKDEIRCLDMINNSLNSDENGNKSTTLKAIEAVIDNGNTV